MKENTRVTLGIVLWVCIALSFATAGVYALVKSGNKSEGSEGESVVVETSLSNIEYV